MLDIAMSIEVSVAESRKFLRCRVTEPITVEVARQIAIETEQLATQTDIQSRLIDVRGYRNVASVSSNYDLAYKGLDELEVERASKAAVLIDADDTSHDFAMIAIRNSGFNVRAFSDEDAAIAWLEE